MSQPDLTDRTGTPVSVMRGPDRFVVSVEGEPAAESFYLDKGEQRVFFHTETLDHFAGRGLAGVLVAEAVRRTLADGLRIVPVCRVVAGYLKKHPELESQVDHPTAEILKWLEEQLSH